MTSAELGPTSGTPRLMRWMVLAALLSACGRPAGSQVPEIVRTLPHDTSASTQGLLLYDGKFFESTGQYGESTLREVDVETGEVIRMIELSDDLFGEGLARVGDTLVQLTWQEGLALVYDLETFESARTFEYDGEGWGLCYDGVALYMSNGSAILHRRDAETFEILESLEVTQDGSPVRNLNELECVDDVVYANVYQTDRILRIDKTTGRVLAEFDASMLVPEGGEAAGHPGRPERDRVRSHDRLVLRDGKELADDVRGALLTPGRKDVPNAIQGPSYCHLKRRRARRKLPTVHPATMPRSGSVSNTIAPSL